MDNDILTALIASGGGLIGSLGGVIAAGKLTAYRLQKLEEKVDKHNHLVERMYDTEKTIGLLDEKMKVANHRIEDLEEAIK